MSPTTQNLARVTKPTDRTAGIERIFNAPLDKVWKAFTDPKLLAQWWGRGHKLDIETYEFKPGGHWRFVEHSEGQTHGFEGRFREITPPKRIAMTFEWDGMPGYPMVNTAEFTDLGDGRTRMQATLTFFTPEERDGMLNSGMEGGMNQSYAALDAVLAKM